MKKIVVVGGGAGGLELVTRLGDTLGRKGRAKVTLIDSNRTHLWKPHLHEVASGSLDAGVEALSYQAHAKHHYFNFQLGCLSALNRKQKEITLSAISDAHGKVIVQERILPYDILVIAVGAVSNDFGTKGVKEHGAFLDTPQQALQFNERMMNRFLQFATEYHEGEKVRVAIVGGGATGIELAAELYHVVEGLHTYGFDNLSSANLEVNIIEAGAKVLPALTDRVRSYVYKELKALGVHVRLNTKIVEATAEGFITAEGEMIAADLMLWAAGVKAPEFLKQLDGLEVNRNNQLVVNEHLLTNDPSIFALGDCAAYLLPSGQLAPPRAQVAHQMAPTVYKNIQALLNPDHFKMKPFCYNDRGSLISLSRFAAVGSLMGNLTKGSMTIQGHLARWAYISLYRMHQMALHGSIKTALIMLVGGINRVLKPSLKLH